MSTGRFDQQNLWTDLDEQEREELLADFARDLTDLYDVPLQTVQDLYALQRRIEQHYDDYLYQEQNDND
jgi:hypothetical protein